jgi:hypothetical protein
MNVSSQLKFLYSLSLKSQLQGLKRISLGNFSPFAFKQLIIPKREKKDKYCVKTLCSNFRPRLLRIRPMKKYL